MLNAKTGWSVGHLSHDNDDYDHHDQSLLVQLGGEGNAEAGDPEAESQLVLDLEVHLHIISIGVVFITYGTMRL